MDDIEYWYGNPSIEVYRGELEQVSVPTGKFLILDIPTSLLILDICDFLQSYTNHIQELRILRSSSSKLYYCAVSIDPSSSSSFLSEFQGRKFNELERNICNIVSIKTWDFKNTPCSSQDKCPICLELIQSFSISILCGHLFHAKCLALWSDPTCPICRYHQSPPDSSQCDTCGEETDVRMCLICGELGCMTHSNQHFASTGHTFFQEVETSKTWDYSRQVPIGRLINSSDKIVEVQDSKKAESVMFEYNCLLSSLLETQKEFYEQKILEIENEQNPLVQQIEELRKENEELRKKVSGEDLEGLEEVVRKIADENRKKKEMTQENEELRSKVKERKVFRVNKEVKDEIHELEEQIKEMKFYLETQKKLQSLDIDSVEIRLKK